ncbi:agmatine/peptidylarginine deiminase [Bradyrhizobium liaoningense]|uniref:agmatine deiminase family protein n=1 Tax=Bradyrhizobium liaoningense TaxID=43992 RepID=UPI001BAB8871|nr:agmatine deiminase family protein [Bradyrhizobium liaoningense]MBR0820257.1 agmatine deiminase family protein [Bradyrhizobium liaoningense]
MTRNSRREASIRIPAEWEPHACCWMAWVVHREWSSRDAARIKRDLTKVVHAIARFEPVRLLAPPGREFLEARKRFSDCPPVTVIEAPVDDFWMRDIMPTFAIRGQGVSKQILAIDWNFNGWGGSPDRPARAGDRLAKTAAEVFGVPEIAASFVAEGGAFSFDGRGTVITTRSCLLNPNRNPVRTGPPRQQAIASGLRGMGIRKVIWLEGDPCEPITSGHVDGYVLQAPGRQILVESDDDRRSGVPLSREHDIENLERARDADGRTLRLVRLAPPRKRYWNGDPDMFAAAYLNVYIANGAVIGPRFGDPERDGLARVALAKAFPGREIILLRIDAIADGGGGVHCLTQPMPAI